MKAITKRFLYALLTAVLCVVTVFCGQVTLSASADTADSVQAIYESTNVLNNLKGATIGGKEFDLKDYPHNSNGKPQILSFVEFCYSYYAEKQADYGLYVYVYNPQDVAFDMSSERNKIQLTYGTKPSYSKYVLEFINYSTEAGYEGRFWKFKVKLTDAQRTAILKEVDEANRIYKISGIELSYKNEVTEYVCGQTYTYKGYALGYGSELAVSDTLSCKVDGLETYLTLDVKHTFYRTKTSSLGAGYQVQLDTVYFSVPETIFEEYGSLQRIKAEWYEYKTTPIAVVNTSSSTYGQAFYEYAKQYIGQSVTGSSALLGSKKYGLGVDVDLNGYDIPGAVKWGWNVMYPNWDKWATNTLYYLFETSQSIQEYDPYAEITSTGGVESNVLYDYITNYNKTFENGKVKDGLISADLFEKDIDDSRKQKSEYGQIQYGYSYYDFDVDADLQELQTFNPSSAGWKDKVAMYGFWNTLFKRYDTEVSKTLPPIQVLTDNDITGSSASKKKAISDTLCVNYNDVDSLQRYYSQAKAKKEKVVLFRFATSDYYSEMADIVYYDTTSRFDVSMPRLEKDSAAYIAQESVFLDFDIIQLAFTKNGVETIIPVVMSPMDIVDDITSPAVIDKGLKLWQIILGILLLILIVWLLLKFCPAIVFVLGKIIVIPFKCIGAVFKSIGNSIKRRKEKKAEKQERELRQEKKIRRRKELAKREEKNTWFSRRKEKKSPKPPDLKGNVKPEEVDAYLDSIDWDSVDWEKLDGKSG